MVRMNFECDCMCVCIQKTCDTWLKKYFHQRNAAPAVTSTLFLQKEKKWIVQISRCSCVCVCGCNQLQHAATLCNTLHAASHCNTRGQPRERLAVCCRHTATHYNMLQHARIAAREAHPLHDDLDVWHDSFACVAWFIHVRDKKWREALTHSYVWQD